MERIKEPTFEEMQLLKIDIKSILENTDKNIDLLRACTNNLKHQNLNKIIKYSRDNKSIFKR